ncbi:polymorphic toxin-type HINT domain-containing protein [Streptomyces sp. NPDC050433]|uniref:polymorphic toxin-type HINT domain-containing protein n=1 Tax=Streptomyces sp. NPDC050433 TaxID=3365615 RepID=UPI003793D980
MFLLCFLFGVTVLGTAGSLSVAASVDAVDGRLIGLLLYASAPGVAALVLARRTWAGGVRVRWALLALQVWLVVGALGTLGAGSGRGVTQLVVPITITVLLFRRTSREWFALPVSVRAERRPFRLTRMIKWRTDGGQSAAEYAGLIVLVAAIVTGLVTTGVGGQISGGLRSAVCEITGSACGGGQAGPVAADGEDGTGGSGGDHSDDGAYGPGYDETDDGYDRTDDHADDGAYDPSLRDPNGRYEGEDDNNGDGDDGESCTSGFGAFFSCAGDELGGAFDGFVIDGVGGDISDAWDTITDPGQVIEDTVEYGRGLGEQWLDDAAGATDKWSDGDYLGALGDWGEASLNTGLTVLDDSFVGDEVREMLNNGDYGQALGLVGWNVGSSFIPGYGQYRWLDRLTGGGDRDTPDGDGDSPQEQDDALPSCPTNHSFLPGTPVLLADGSRMAIDEVRVGMRVIATDPESGRTEARSIERTITTYDDKDFTRLTVLTDSGTETLTATDTHPFWLTDKVRWADAGDIKPGDDLRTPAGTSVQVTAVEHYTKRQVTHDLTVNGIHTYYVLAGSTPVLVHNSSGCAEDAYAIEDHVIPRHTRGGAEADATKSLFEDGVNLGELAAGSAGQIGHYQPATGNIRYFITGREIVGTDRHGLPTNTYTIVRDGRDGELITMHPGLPRDLDP